MSTLYLCCHIIISTNTISISLQNLFIFPPMMFHSREAYVCRMNNTAEKRTMSLVVYAILSPVQSQLFWGLGDKKKQTRYVNSIFNEWNKTRNFSSWKKNTCYQNSQPLLLIVILACAACLSWPHKCVVCCHKSITITNKIQSYLKLMMKWKGCNIPVFPRVTSICGSPYSSWSIFFRTRAKKAAKPRTWNERS